MIDRFQPRRRLAQMGLLLCAVVLSLAGCGGGGGGGSTPAEGQEPGVDYFPLNVGDRWRYTDGSGLPTLVEVTGTQATASGTAMVVQTDEQAAGSTQRYVRSATGVVLVPSTQDDAVTQALGTLQVLRLPLVTGNAWVVADRALDGLLDVDGDGQADRLSVRVEASVIGYESVSTPAGTFSRCAHVRTVMTRVAQLSSNRQSVTTTLTSDDWYAPDVGPVRSRIVDSSDPPGTVTELLATHWRVGSRRSDSVAPTAGSLLPASDSVAYGANPLVQVGFSEVMDTRIAVQALLTLTGPDGQAVSGSAQWLDDHTIGLTFATGLVSGRYSARLRTGLTDLVGNALASETRWDFTVDASAPAPTLVQPLPNAAEVPLDSRIVIQLDETPDPASVNAGTVRLVDLVSSSEVPAALALVDRTITLTPTAPLRTGGRYMVSVSGVADTHGNLNYNAGSSWNFTADPGRFAAPERLFDGGNANVTAAAIGDVDGDGRADAVVALGYGSGAADQFMLLVRRSLGGGAFAAVQRYATIAAYGSEIGSLQVADIDRNGRPAVIAAASGRGLQIFRQQPDGTLASSQVIDTPASTVVRVMDMNGDGRPDLVSAPFYGDSVSVWLQQADGRFGAATVVPVNVGSFGDIAVGDLDGDGWPDIAVTNGGSPSTPVSIVTRTADGGYAAARTPTLPNAYSVSGATIGDVNADGRPDLVLAQSSGSLVTVLAQQADGSLQATVQVRGASNTTRVRVVDLDGDGQGRGDVLSWSWGGYPVALNRQRRDGTLGAVETWPVSDYGIWTPHLVAVGDLDGDGRPDLIYGSSWLRQRVVAYTEPDAGTLAAPRRAAATATPATQARGMLRALSHLALLRPAPRAASTR